jgi:DNA-binding winged helix-turn-helix (wHTH) protein/tetratricopeptide (TPR) repeat protein
MNSTQPTQALHFGKFSVRPSSRTLSKNGTPIRLYGQSFEILLMLLEHPGDVITRDELKKRLWPSNTFVDFENGLNAAIRNLRRALNDSPEAPKYVQTVPRIGYRFIAEVFPAAPGVKEPVSGVTLPTDGTDGSAAYGQSSPPIAIGDGNAGVLELPSARKETSTATPRVTEPISPKSSRYGRFVLLSVLGICAGLVFFAFLRRPRTSIPQVSRILPLTNRDTIVLADFTNMTGDSVFEGTLRQGLAVQLEQSPFLSLVSDLQIQQSLQMMGQKPDAKLTPEIAREVCLRIGSATVLDGSIAQIGTQYLLTVKAVNCGSGESLASTEAQANDKNHVLDALGKTASEIREKLGESLSTVQKFDTPLEQATTPSLEALKAFTLGSKVWTTTGSAAAIPFYKRAIELEPNFALADAWLGRLYADIGESSVAAEYARKAYELRDRTSDPEKYFISASYQIVVTGNMEKAEQICELWKQTYPRAEVPRDFLSGLVYPVTGENEKSVEEGKETVRLFPERPIPPSTLMFSYIALNRLDEAKATYKQILEHNLNSPYYHIALYEIAFLEDDAQSMAKEVSWSAGKSGVQDELLDLEAHTAAFFGRLQKAREFSRQAADSAERAAEKETAATYVAVSALREALFGNADEARRRATLALKRSTGRDVEYGAALAFAYAGDNRQTLVLTDDLGKRFPEDTLVQFNYLPILRAELAIKRGSISEAVESLRAAAPYDLGESTVGPYSWSALYPVFVRGEAYLTARQGKEAAAEFQRVLDQRGLVLNEPIGALARLQIGRAYAMQGDAAKAKAAYQDFLTLWKDADPNIPILKQAKAEYAKLQ